MDNNIVMTEQQTDQLHAIGTYLRTLGRAHANVHESQRDDDLASTLTTLGEQIKQILYQA